MLNIQEELNCMGDIIMATTKKLNGNAKDAVECLQELKRKTKDPTERKKIDRRIKDIKECCK